MEGLIRKIVIGRDPKEAMAYYVGMQGTEKSVRYSWTKDTDTASIKTGIWCTWKMQTNHKYYGRRLQICRV
jgi:hypothetical protein